MGWATIGAKGKPKTGDLIKALFSPGDRTVLPRTPGIGLFHAFTCIYLF